MFALNPKVFRGLDQARPKIMLPESIDRDTSRQRMGGTDQPLCQTKPIGGRVRRRRAEPRGNVRRNLVTLQRVLATFQNMRLSRFRTFLHHQCRRDGLCQFGQFLFQSRLSFAAAPQNVHAMSD